jgi:carbon monoxide dehydrogenase subunit G
VQFEETFELAFPRELVWTAFQDIPLLVSCLPGASVQGDYSVDRLQLIFAVKLGPIAARFAGEGSVDYREDCTGILTGSATDRATGSRVRGSAAFVLEPVADATRVGLLIDYALSGMLAQVGRPGIVRELAAGLTRQFAANLRARIAERAGPGAAIQGSVEGDDVQEAGGSTAPINAAALLGDALVAKMKKMIGKQA